MSCRNISLIFFRQIFILILVVAMKKAIYFYDLICEIDKN
ncbi:unnamed protein product [marine sediment metagenome]|uniref:Uncharacterized protein n=1 Tax=marine sediment metagenome TaxID=412755 RepID=X1GT71_9ZZZZ